jgi:hypothetical protein
MTSTLGINDAQPRNLESPRSMELVPEQVRITANQFMTLLTEYYKFMNLNEWATTSITASTATIDSYGNLVTSTSTIPTSSVLVGKSGSGPSNVLYSVLSQIDVDQIDADYLPHIQATLASLVPIPTYISTSSSTALNTAPYYKYLSVAELASLRALLYQKVVKFFYVTRGSRDSASSFFRIFYNDSCTVYDYNDFLGTMTTYVQNWLTSSGMSLSSTTVSAGSAVNGQTPIQAWLPFSYAITPSTAQSIFDVPYRALVHPVGFKYFVQPSLAGGLLDVSESRMTDARYDYQTALWFLDSTQIAEFANFVISDATNGYIDGFQNTAATTSTYTYADWSNIGTIEKFNVSLSSQFIQATNTLSISTTSSLNIFPGMFISAPNAFFTPTGTTSTASIVSINSSSTSTGIITLNGTLSSSTLAANTIISFFS